MKESPYLLWLTKKEMDEALIEIIRRKKPGSISMQRVANPQEELIALFRTMSTLIRKVEYVSFLDQDEEQEPLSSVRFRQQRKTVSDLTHLSTLYFEENPEKDPSKTTLEEFYFWYLTQVRNGRRL